MPRVVPSQIVKFIDNLKLDGGVTMMVSIGPAALSAVLELVDHLPDELLTIGPDDFGSLLIAKSAIRNILDTWTSNRNAGHGLYGFQHSRETNPLLQIRNLLAQCPDQSPAPGTSDLNFITDAALRSNLRNDIGAVTRALSNGEWKAATVLSGSIAEALLLWALSQRSPSEISTTANNLISSKVIATPQKTDLEWWNLHQLIETAAALRVITDNTKKQILLAKDFRNFIHPGVAIRKGQQCDRATAFSAVAGVEHIVRDLT